MGSERSSGPNLEEVAVRVKAERPLAIVLRRRVFDSLIGSLRSSQLTDDAVLVKAWMVGGAHHSAFDGPTPRSKYQ